MGLQVLKMNNRKEANPLSIYRVQSGFSRRSHLDSATYRTLLRIFSLCLDEQECNQCLDDNVEKDIDLGTSITIEEMSETSREGEVDGDDFEEGEIPNDFEDSDQHLNLVDEPEDNKSGEILVSKSFHKSGGNPDCTNLLDVHSRTEEDCLRTDLSSTLICASNQRLNAFGDDGYLKPEEMKSCRLSASGDADCTSAGPDTLRFLGENLKSSTNVDKERSSKTEVVEIQVNKKRGPPTEERKAKKKRAKKRKRAQKEREQGVSRLKLQPIVKPKEVKYCNFYLVGRCQQGELCKFSHDMTPLTKSQPCKYFACDSCLKGDDCQFDHQLSKYPCHNYTSKGMCIRGGSCKFSHKLPVTEGLSPTSVMSKADSLLSTKKSNFVKQHPMNRTTASCSQSVTHKPSTENLVSAPKFPMQIPNGIRFLSFGKGPSVDADKQKNGQQRDGNAKSLVQRSVHAAECEKNTLRSGTSVCSAATTCNATKKSKVDDSYRSLQTEASEASKILEEFLFCGTN